MNYEFNEVAWSEAGNLRLTGMPASHDMGGLGFSAVETALCLEKVGLYSRDGGLNFALAAHNLACLVPLVLYGTEQQKQDYVGRMASGQLVAGNGMTESIGGSDIMMMQMTASGTSNGTYIINGEKSFVTNGPLAGLFLCYVLTNPEKGFLGGMTCFILDKEKHKFSVSENEHKLGLRTCTMCKIQASEVEVSKEYILGKEGMGDRIFHQSMLWERTCLPALYVGTLERLLPQAIEFCKARNSNGVPISRHQAVAHKLVDIKTSIVTSRQLIHQAAMAIDENKNATQLSSMAKYHSSTSYQKAMLDFHQIFAGQAFRGSNDIERHLRDSMASTLYSGPTEIQKNIIASTMGL